MARANPSATHPLPTEEPVTLLYIKGEDADLPYLDRGLSLIVARYAPRVELRTLAPHQVPAEHAALSLPTPSVLVMRRGEIVGEALGALLPLRELDRVVRCAVEWAR